MSSTSITLNDRFLMLQKSDLGAGSGGGGRGRSRSRSRGRQQPQISRNANNGRLQGSRRNQKLLTAFETQLKARATLRNVSCCRMFDMISKKHNLNSLLFQAKSTLRPGRIQGRAQIIRNRARRAATIKKAIRPQALRRANSLTTFVPLKDEPSRARSRGRSRSRSRSRNRSQQRIQPQQQRQRSQQRQPQQQQRGSVLDRLGYPAGGAARQGRGRMRRGPPANQPQQQRSRSRSRVKLNRGNFANNQQLKRSNSKMNLAPHQQQQQAQKRRANSRARRPGGVVGGGANQLRRQPRNSVNSRLNRPVGGRIVKRTTNARAGQVQKMKQRRGAVMKNGNRWHDYALN